MTTEQTVETGQTWQECDPCSRRMVEVVSVDRIAGTVRIKHGNRVTTAKLSRFNGKRSGYKRVK